MPFYFSWGKTFLAIFGEFWPWQIKQIHDHASELFERRPQDADLEREHGIRASVIPFEKFDYEFVLVLRDDIWTLEVANLPPHAKPGQRIRRARRKREQEECKARRQPGSAAGLSSKQGKRAKAAKGRGRKPKGEDAARTISTIKQMRVNARRAISLKLYNIGDAVRRYLEQFRHTAALFAEHMKEAIPASQSTARHALVHVPSREDCRAANIAGWARDRLPPGCQRERRLFFADFLPIWLDTIAPIDSIFVLGGRSVFGELSMEGECVS